MPGGATVSGTVTFTADARASALADPTLDELGSYDIELRRVVGDARMRSIGEVVGPDALVEVEGYVHDERRVAITFIPEILDPGLYLWGTISG